MKDKSKKCELLVPAGGPEQFISAVENGADAVYVGGRLFNARMNAGNFSDEELEEAVKFAHQRGVAVHVTVNVLLKDSELEEAVEYCAFLYRAGVDAVIIQDLGLAKLLHEVLPELTLHMSTQDSVYDLREVREAKKLGFSRVVLARELSAEEIGYISGNTDMETEVFVHGALCICYSGQCHLSRSNGGKSGNRGACAQPCRLPYETVYSGADNGGSGKRGRSGSSEDPGRYPLSPKDLCLLGDIGRLIDMGVDSFKVEGRMKSPEYVAVVTSIYRKYIDRYYETGSVRVDKADITAIQQIFSRGGSTGGYFEGIKDSRLMSGSVPKHQGVKAGTVISQSRDGELVDVELSGDLAMGDGFEIHTRRGVTGNIVTYYKDLGGGRVRIGDVRDRVLPGDSVFRTSSKEQLEKAGETFRGKTFEKGKFIRKTLVDMVLSKRADGAAGLEVRCGNVPAVRVFSDGPAELQPFEDEEAMERAYSRMESGLRKTGGTAFEASSVRIDSSVDGRMKISAVNDLRRRALEKLASEISSPRVISDPESRKADLDEILSCGRKTAEMTEKNERSRRLQLWFYTMDDMRRAFSDSRFRGAVTAQEAGSDILVPLAGMALEHEQNGDESFSGADIPEGCRIIPYISNISRGLEDEIIERDLDFCLGAASGGVYAGDLTWASTFRENGISVFMDFGLNVYNREAERAYELLGLKKGVPSLETDDVHYGSI
ncbi:MAG: U32 family peptidase, partial [Anaerovoracaceae bacterium]